MGDKSGDSPDDRVLRGFEAAREKLMRNNASSRAASLLGSSDVERATYRRDQLSVQGTTVSQNHHPVVTVHDNSTTSSGTGKNQVRETDVEDFPPLDRVTGRRSGRELPVGKQGEKVERSNMFHGPEEHTDGDQLEGADNTMTKGADDPAGNSQRLLEAQQELLKVIQNEEQGNLQEDEVVSDSQETTEKDMTGAEDQGGIHQLVTLEDDTQLGPLAMVLRTPDKWADVVERKWQIREHEGLKGGQWTPIVLQIKETRQSAVCYKVDH
ncbi:hypothetical protein R1sor_009779 [Riccia sorocarpa]|uniref:Uncharacterized protein n=1 Tax=Riccia sorocarpa TaxID=122646 RepID=A0ABD3HW30_9MARC